MAQLVEQRIRNAWVAGSSPAGGSKQTQSRQTQKASSVNSLFALKLSVS